MALGFNRTAGLAETCGFFPRVTIWANSKCRRSLRALHYRLPEPLPIRGYEPQCTVRSTIVLAGTAPELSAAGIQRHSETACLTTPSIPWLNGG